MKTKIDTTAVCLGQHFAVPAGTEVIRLSDGMGKPCYAIASTAVAKKLSGNDWSPRYYEAWVPAEAVEE
jgi:hypothetical protein